MLTSIFSFLKLSHDVAVQAPVRAAAMQQSTEGMPQTGIGAASTADDDDDTFARPAVFADSLFDWPGI